MSHYDRKCAVKLRLELRDNWTDLKRDANVSIPKFYCSNWYV